MLCVFRLARSKPAVAPLATVARRPGRLYKRRAPVARFEAVDELFHRAAHDLVGLGIETSAQSWRRRRDLRSHGLRHVDSPPVRKRDNGEFRIGLVGPHPVDEDLGGRPASPWSSMQSELDHFRHGSDRRRVERACVAVPTVYVSFVYAASASS